MRAVILISWVFLSGCTCAQSKAFTRLWFDNLARATNWILADNEARKYSDQKAEARLFLQELRHLDSPVVISKKLQSAGFHWEHENVDFTSYPWVTIARKRGDCDDYQDLWVSALKGKGETRKVFVSSVEGRAHAMVLFTKGDDLYLLSNVGVRGVGKPGDEETLIRLFYKEQTDCYLIY